MNNFYNLPLSYIHIELTTKCNAACPMCLRNLQGDRLNPSVINSDFQIEWLDNIDLPVNKLIACGNYGDPAAYINLYEFLEKWYTKFDKPVKLMTNGGLRTADYWKSLASFGKNRLQVVFGIDGLEDTNHLYRRNVRWDKLIENADAFISSGGNAIWKFIIFKHNQHQVDSAKQLATKMNFTAFEKIKTNRFAQDKFAVIDKDGNEIYYLEEPIYDDNFISKNPNRKSSDTPQEKYIDCYAKKESSLYIAADGRVYPCCNTGYHFDNTKTNKEVLDFQDTVGIGKIQISNLSNIVQHRFFTELQNSWSTTPLRRCSSICSKRRDNLHKVENII